MKTLRAHERVCIARILLLSSSLLILGMAGLMAQAKAGGSQGSKPKEPATTSPDSDQDAEAGQKKFQANCSRCHDAPEQFSPRIAGTIVRHMRVRASLSAQDEKDILKFLAP